MIKLKKELISGIYQDADWLKSLVENILSLTRLQDGKIVVHKEMEAIEEIIASSVAHIEKIYINRTINVKIPESFVLVPMDARLIEQVITNLLDNAVKHTDENEMISVEAEYEKDNLVVRVIMKVMVLQILTLIISLRFSILQIDAQVMLKEV